MMDRPLAAFDIETIPDPELGRRLGGHEGDDAEVVRAMVARRLEETDGKTEYPQLPYHRVVTIGVAWLDPASGQFELGTVGGDAMDERSHLEGFFALLRDAGAAPRLVSWNGGGYDLPVIRYRSMLRGVAAGDFYRREGGWRFNNYDNRYHDMHVDLMDVLSGYRASPWVGLGTLSEVLGLPGKPMLDEPVYAHLMRGEEQRIREYCKLDVLETLLLYLVWAVHRGALAPEALRAHVGTIGAALAADPYGAWPEIARGLEGWPAWA